jgi:hypothetical protein
LAARDFIRSKWLHRLFDKFRLETERGKTFKGDRYVSRVDLYPVADASELVRGE